MTLPDSGVPIPNSNLQIRMPNSGGLSRTRVDLRTDLDSRRGRGHNEDKMRRQGHDEDKMRTRRREETRRRGDTSFWWLLPVADAVPPWGQLGVICWIGCSFVGLASFGVLRRPVNPTFPFGDSGALPLR